MDYLYRLFSNLRPLYGAVYISFSTIIGLFLWIVCLGFSAILYLYSKDCPQKAIQQYQAFYRIVCNRNFSYCILETSLYSKDCIQQTFQQSQIYIYIPRIVFSRLFSNLRSIFQGTVYSRLFSNLRPIFQGLSVVGFSGSLEPLFQELSKVYFSSLFVLFQGFFYYSGLFQPLQDLGQPATILQRCLTFLRHIKSPVFLSEILKLCNKILSSPSPPTTPQRTPRAGKMWQAVIIRVQGESRVQGLHNYQWSLIYSMLAQ